MYTILAFPHRLLLTTSVKILHVQDNFMNLETELICFSILVVLLEHAGMCNLRSDSSVMANVNRIGNLSKWRAGHCFHHCLCSRERCNRSIWRYRTFLDARELMIDYLIGELHPVGCHTLNLAWYHICQLVSKFCPAPKFGMVSKFGFFKNCWPPSFFTFSIIFHSIFIKFSKKLKN